MKDNKDHRIDDLLIRYLDGRASDDECKELENWIGLNDENTEYFERVKTIWESSANLKAYQQIDTESSLKKVKKQLKLKQGKRLNVRNLWIAARIAALLLLFFGIYAIFRQKDGLNAELKITRIESGNEIRSILLPDSSLVILNKLSAIEYAGDYNTFERRIKFEGEAYFEVKPDKEHPFSIETDRSVTRVLGTAFNLKAWPGSKTESIVVTSGLVEYRKKNGTGDQKVQLEMGEKAILAGKLTKETNRDLNFMAWKTGIVTFANEPLPEALEFLSSYYQVEINIQDSSIQTYSLSGKYEKKSLEEMIEILEITLQVKSEKKNNKYWLKP